jgi:Ribbon-helix-helix protein, copG family
VRRTQLYLDDDLWKALQIRSRESGSTISELVRQAVRDRYCDAHSGRKTAMQALVGIRKNRPEFANVESYVRKLRRGSRLRRLE